MSHKALKLLRKKYKAYGKHKSVNHPAYRKAARTAKEELRKARHNFESKLEQNIRSDKKTFFAYMQSKSKCKTVPGPLINQSGELLHEPREMSEEFNKFFSSGFTKEKISEIPHVHCDNLVPQMDSIIITEEMVHNCLKKLRAEPDDISPRLLIKISDEIIVPLTIIFNKSLESGSAPDDWCTANVSPIFKNGKRNLPQNYRPVSLTSQVCKLFEHIIREELVNHFESHQLIGETQHGVRKGRSCLTNLLVFLNEVSWNMDNNNCMDAIYYAALLPRRGRILRCTLSVCLSVCPSVCPSVPLS